MSCRKNACDRCSFFAATVSNSSLMGVQNYHLLPYSTVRLCVFQRRIPDLINLNPPSIVGFSPVSTLLFSNSDNWRSEDCIVLSFISEAFAYRLKEEAPEMDQRCKFW
ncbi:hypothetical protein T03_14464 [Trichinella britovi]|uniref:Uncharacterized protein n=1 Tax=Trichinella britovi TaxID=45882 RepID=A0A0V1C4G5_TRIBR|nr:hypothetical protein T03_14464 [Trichinella britovi]